MADQARCVVCAVVKNGWRCVAANGHICRACYRREYAPREICGVCRERKIVNARPDDVPHCEACYKRILNRAPCVFCKTSRTVHGRDEKKRPVCLDCYERHLQKPERCLFCEETKACSYRAPTGEAICRPCYQRELLQAVCIDCGSMAHVAARTTRDEPLCHHCSFERRTPERCPLCRELEPLLDCKNGERICQPCWRKHRTPQETCATCGAVERVATWLTPSRPICPNCWARRRRASGAA